MKLLINLLNLRNLITNGDQPTTSYGSIYLKFLFCLMPRKRCKEKKVPGWTINCSLYRITQKLSCTHSWSTRQYQFTYPIRKVCSCAWRPFRLGVCASFSVFPIFGSWHEKTPHPLLNQCEVDICVHGTKDDKKKPLRLVA